jgi:hypothetical protein
VEALSTRGAVASPCRPDAGARVRRGAWRHAIEREVGGGRERERGGLGRCTVHLGPVHSKFSSFLLFLFCFSFYRIVLQKFELPNDFCKICDLAT